MLTVSLFARLEAKPGKEEEVAAFLRQGLELANQEATTPLWFPEQFFLRMDRDGSRRKCHIVWREEKRIGVQFD